MVRYERPNVLRRCLPLVRGLPREGARPHVLRLILALGAWGLAFALMVVCAFISSFRYPKGTEALPDLTYSLVPHHVVHPLPDILLYTLMASVVGRMIFHPEGIAIARRFAAIASCIYVFRSIALISTSFPDPQSKCEDYDPSWNLGVFLKHSCGGDMMGHTVNLALAGLVWSQYTKHKLLYLVAWLTSFAAMVLFIVNRSHYTIDVLISLFISVSCWKYYHSTLLLPPQHQNSLIKWLEKTNHESNDLTRGNQGNIQGQGGLTLASVTSHVTSALASNPLTLVTPLNPLSGPSKYQVLSEDSKYNDDNITGSPGTSP